MEKKARIEKEESALDKKISSLKAEMLQLRSDSQVLVQIFNYLIDFTDQEL